jgi:hypothetical protein
MFTAGFLLVSCNKSEGPKDETSKSLFSKVTPDRSGIRFKNEIKQTTEFNFMNYMYIYTGAGVAVGDIDRDGLEDIYLVSNFGPNKLYKNLGDLEFEDITSSSGVEDYSGFSTGVTMLDVNADGWLDIYVVRYAMIMAVGTCCSSTNRTVVLKKKVQNGGWTTPVIPPRSTPSITTRTGIWICMY